MKCAWDKYLNLLPVRLRKSVDGYADHVVQEVRMRKGQQVEVATQKGSFWLDQIVTNDDLAFTVNIASRYSPWSSATTACGYITAPGGHRVGICGQAVMTGGVMQGIRAVSSLCIRTACDFPGIAAKAAQLKGSILILGRPGSGKTTLLRDLIRQKARENTVSVIDEREELFPQTSDGCCFSVGKRTDIMTGCRKPAGIDAVLRTMSPDYIAVDEITAQEDCEGLLHAGWCGVMLLATAHAQNKTDLFNRPVYKPLVQSGIFNHLLILRPDKTWHLERMSLCC